MSDAQKRILVGRFGAPHGVRGEIRLKSFTDDPEAIAGYETLATGDGAPVEILSLRPQKEMLVVRLKGCDSREAAQALNGVELYIDRSELPETEDEDEFYLADLIGLEARAPDGETIGKVIAVENFGAGDIIEIKPVKGPAFMIAFTRESVPEIDLDAGYLVLVRPPETEARGEGGQ
ncbi:MAG: ribosome maturation factor RimM [Salaquimonas sp.]|jgi:16S rRNA processing protein RimM|nr:ribosome maturation factor RimM [Salaquimonas sp.]